MTTVLAFLLSGVSWIGISVLSFFLWRIARFYEHSSGETAHSWLFLFPMILLPTGAACYIFEGADFVGIPVGDLLLFAGGICLLFASARLERIMVGER